MNTSEYDIQADEGDHDRNDTKVTDSIEIEIVTPEILKQKQIDFELQKQKRLNETESKVTSLTIDDKSRMNNSTIVETLDDNNINDDNEQVLPTSSNSPQINTGGNSVYHSNQMKSRHNNEQPPPIIQKNHHRSRHHESSNESDDNFSLSQTVELESPERINEDISPLNNRKSTQYRSTSQSGYRYRRKSKNSIHVSTVFYILHFVKKHFVIS